MLKTFIFSVFCFSIFRPATSNQTQGSSRCDTVVVQYKIEMAKDYYIPKEFVGNFFDAIKYCNRHNMDLVSTESEEEHQFIFDSLTDHVSTNLQDWFWTSGTALPEHKWVWLPTGDFVVNSRFTPTDYLYNVDDTCLAVYRNKYSGDLGWTSSNCLLKGMAICEARKATLVN